MILKIDKVVGAVRIRGGQDQALAKLAEIGDILSLQINMVFTLSLIGQQIDVKDKDSRSFGSHRQTMQWLLLSLIINLQEGSVNQLNYLEDSLTTWKLLALFLHEIAGLLGRVHINEPAMCTLDNMIVIRDAEAVLPVICVGIRQLIILPRSLIGNVEHALIVCNHSILLEADGDDLRIVGVKFSQSLESPLGDNRGTFVCIHHDPASVWHSSKGKDALLTNLCLQKALDKAVI